MESSAFLDNYRYPAAIDILEVPLKMPGMGTASDTESELFAGQAHRQGFAMIDSLIISSNEVDCSTCPEIVEAFPGGGLAGAGLLDEGD
jgi:hypothetical protein